MTGVQTCALPISNSETNSHKRNPSTSNPLNSKGDGGGNRKPPIRPSVKDSVDDDTYKSTEGGGGTTDTITVNGIQVKFGHGGRHLEGTGLSINRVNNMIAHDVVSKKFDVKDFIIEHITIDGIQIEYRAFKLAEDVINIGTYFIPK